MVARSALRRRDHSTTGPFVSRTERRRFTRVHVSVSFDDHERTDGGGGDPGPVLNIEQKRSREIIFAEKH